MHTTQDKKDQNLITGRADLSSVGRGHRPHRGGGGKHGDRRLKRQKTRQTQHTQAMRD